MLPAPNIISKISKISFIFEIPKIFFISEMEIWN